MKMEMETRLRRLVAEAAGWELVKEKKQRGSSSALFVQRMDRGQEVRRYWYDF